MSTLQKARLALNDRMQDSAALTEKRVTDLQGKLEAQAAVKCPVVTPPVVPVCTPPAPAKKPRRKPKPATQPDEDCPSNHDAKASRTDSIAEPVQRSRGAPEIRRGDRGG